MKTVKKYLSLALILTLALTFLSANSLIQPVYAAGSTGPNGEFIPPGYELATDADFHVYPSVDPDDRPYRFHYVGTKPYVVIPHKIQGWELEGRDYSEMFIGNKNVRGVASNNPKITDMSLMFHMCESPSLDLRYLDTSNVVYMDYMFSQCLATTINLSNFDTSKVESMMGMFSYSKVKTLNLDHFDCSKLINAMQMFELCEATSISFKSFNIIPYDDFLAKVKEREATEHVDLLTWNATAACMYSGTKITSIDISNLSIDGYEHAYNVNPLQLDRGSRYVSLWGIINHSNIKTIYVGNAEVKKYLETDLVGKPADLKIIMK